MTQELIDQVVAEVIVRHPKIEVTRIFNYVTCACVRFKPLHVDPRTICKWFHGVHDVIAYRAGKRDDEMYVYFREALK